MNHYASGCWYLDVFFASETLGRYVPKLEFGDSEVGRYVPKSEFGDSSRRKDANDKIEYYFKLRRGKF